jgi:hypothetical protein
MKAFMTNRNIAVGLVAAALFVTLGTYVFGYSMETLDVKAEHLGMEAKSLFPSPFPEYIVPGLESDVANLLLGLISTLVVFGVAWVVLKTLSRRGVKASGV